MTRFIPKATLACFICLSIALGGIIQKPLTRVQPSPFRHRTLDSQRQQRGLTKKASLEWKLISATHYQYLNGSWSFSSRDTVAYDGQGNKVMAMSTEAQKGWQTDSLLSLDSLTYVGGNLSGDLSLTFDSGAVTGGFRETNAYMNAGKTIVTVDYTFDSSKATLVPGIEDSITFSSPVSNLSPWSWTYANYISEYYHIWNSTSSSWNDYGYLARVDSECNATTLVLAGKTSLDSTNNLFDTKLILIFRTSDWTIPDTEEDWLVKNSSTNTYYDTWKAIYSLSGETDYLWDTAMKVWTCMSKDIHFQDSHGNDSLWINANYDTSVLAWDTLWMIRYARSYDANLNNVVTVETDYDFSSQSWIISSKDVNVFAQINSPVIRQIQAPSSQTICMVSTGFKVCFFAPGITALSLYDVSGRLIAAVTQQAAPSISVNFAGLRSHASGFCIAEVIAKNGKTFFPFAIR